MRARDRDVPVVSTRRKFRLPRDLICWRKTSLELQAREAGWPQTALWPQMANRARARPHVQREYSAQFLARYPATHRPCRSPIAEDLQKEFWDRRARRI